MSVACSAREDGSLDVELRNLPGWEVLVYPSSEKRGWFVVKVIYEGPDTDTGVRDYFSVTYLWRRRGAKPPSAAKVASWVRQTVLAQMAHEVDEALHVNGRRARDPHRLERRKAASSAAT